MTLKEHRDDLMVLVPIEDVMAYHMKTDWLNSVVNQGYRDFVRRTHILQDTYTDSVAASTTNKALPADFMSELVIAWRFDSQTEYHQLFERVASGYYDSGSTGTPQEYIFKSPATIQLVPLPSEAGKLRIIYCKRPAELTADANESTVPEEYHMTVQLYCLWRVYQRLGKLKEAFAYKQEYDSDVFRARSELANRGRLWAQITEVHALVGRIPRVRVD